MKKDDCFLLGHVAKTHGFKGEVSIKIDADDPYRYEKLDAFFVEVHGQLTPFFTTYFKLNNKGIAKVKIEGVDSEDEARILLGNNVFLPLTALPELKGNQFYFHEIIGFQVVDTLKGNIGNVREVMDQTSQAILIIEQKEAEILIPITDETIQTVDRAGKTLTITAPEGLIDLYL